MYIHMYMCVCLSVCVFCQWKNHVCTQMFNADIKILECMAEVNNKFSSVSLLGNCVQKGILTGSNAGITALEFDIEVRWQNWMVSCNEQI